MTFTDDDLKRLKEMTEERYTDLPQVTSANGEYRRLCKALLARLKAAEEVIKAGVFPAELDNAGMNALNEWCRACGKENYEKWRKAAGK